MSDISPKEEEITGAIKANEDLGAIMDNGRHFLSTDKGKDVLNTYENAELIYKDSLTGLYNRRGFDEQLKTFCSHARRTGEILSLAFLDVDNFKNINSKYGRLMGDEILKGIAASMKESFRFSDALARWGGDEFVAIMISSSEEVPVNENILSDRLNSNLKNKFVPEGVDSDDVSITVGVKHWNGTEDLNDFQKSVQDHMDSRK